MVRILGLKGLIAVIGIVIFYYSYHYSIEIFDWIEQKTYGSRTYILEKLKFLYIEIEPQNLTYLLLFVSVGMGFISLIIMGLLVNWTFGVIFALIISAIGFKMPKLVIDILVERRIKSYSLQMVDALQLLSNGIRAGLSLSQAVGMVVDEMPAPIGQEFNIILQQNRIGIPLEECFSNLAIRIPLEDNEMFVSSINILKEAGGNLSETFDTIVDVIRERVRLQQKVDTYVAQGMIQAIFIGSAPLAIGIMYGLQDPKGMSRLFTSIIGIGLLLIALALNITGMLIILKIVKIKI